MRLLKFDDELRVRHGVRWLAGADEAGRGPLAGPVVAAVVVLGPGPSKELRPVKDSKVLSAELRERLYPVIRRSAVRCAVAWADPEEIDRHNILRASLLAMRRAFHRVGLDPADLVLAVDGPHAVPDVGCRQQPIVDGDAKSLAIACASILAKVVRDRWMRHLHRAFPGYGFESHKGYGTPEHLDALARLGPSPIHRRSFQPVARLIRS